jgi:endonuclease-8
MPEGPETRRAADKLGEAIVGRAASEVFFAFPELRAAQRELTGRTVTRVTSRGKAMLTYFEGGRVVYSHNQLYGRWYVRKPYAWPKTNRQLRFAIHTDRHSALLYSASEIDVLAEDELGQHPFLARLGPDALDKSVRSRTIERRLASKQFQRRGIAGLLLDQGFVAGLGNYLRSEIAFFAGIRPERRPVDLDPEERKRLARAVLTITRRAYRTGGVTNPAALAKDLRAGGHPRRAYRHAVFGRSGQPCWTCGQEIERIDLAGRRAYVCPDCQV